MRVSNSSRPLLSARSAQEHVVFAEVNCPDNQPERVYTRCASNSTRPLLSARYYPPGQEILSGKTALVKQLSLSWKFVEMRDDQLQTARVVWKVRVSNS